MDKKMEHQHDFDGIEELDNDLPQWWLGIFWVSIAFAIFYVPYYHFMHPESLPEASYEAEMNTVKAERALAEKEAEANQPAAEAAGDPEEALMAKYKAGGWEEAAKADYMTNCLACHGPDGGGTIGPNFTDDYYIHGGTLTQIQKVITDGVPLKGMISWKPVLKPQQIENLTFYIRALRGTTPATPKEAQGQKVDEAGNFIEE